jgi:hypothetical protein
MKATVFLVTLLAFSAQAAFASGHTGNSSDPLDTRIYKNGLWFGAGVNWTER